MYHYAEQLSDGTVKKLGISVKRQDISASSRRLRIAADAEKINVFSGDEPAKFDNSAALSLPSHIFFLTFDIRPFSHKKRKASAVFFAERRYPCGSVSNLFFVSLLLRGSRFTQVSEN